jgi:hypothetical protein
VSKHNKYKWGDGVQKRLYAEKRTLFWFGSPYWGRTQETVLAHGTSYEREMKFLGCKEQTTLHVSATAPAGTNEINLIRITVQCAFEDKDRSAVKRLIRWLNRKYGAPSRESTVGNQIAYWWWDLK